MSICYFALSMMDRFRLVCFITFMYFRLRAGGYSYSYADIIRSLSSGLPDDVITSLSSLVKSFASDVDDIGDIPLFDVSSASVPDLIRSLLNTYMPF